MPQPNLRAIPRLIRRARLSEGLAARFSAEGPAGQAAGLTNPVTSSQATPQSLDRGGQGSGRIQAGQVGERDHTRQA